MLVVGPAWVGDMVMAQAVLRLLAARRPGVAIDVIAPPWSLPLVRRMPEVREAIALEVGHGEFGLGARWRLARRLRRRGYGQALLLPRSFKAALVPWLAGIPRRTGHLGEARRGLVNDVRPDPGRRRAPWVRRMAVLALEPGEAVPEVLPQPRLAVDEANRARLMTALGLAGEGPVLGLCPGAEYGPSKRWPARRYGALAARMAARGWRVWVFGSARERPLGEEVVAASGGAARNLCGRTRLEDVVDLMSACERVVTNDSGLMHVAAATGTALTVIYGASSPDYTPPLTPRARIVRRALACAPCFRRVCPLGHTACLEGIEVEEVERTCTP
ncbi:heptosyltransferase-2 [Inmirania thermothiophila]|uniref:lipopolysaccharide heptosyltransferase II n=1 Tax=Inmirania thermothiophila TaxID=1750597 RepID=A0A3N1XSI6_9GAMM|nr:heptosyltransferase-2 [Inmirania thermothiophila]